MKYDVFLSYNRDDKKAAKEILDALRNLGFNVYFNPEARQGEISELEGALKAEIDQSRRFALLHGRNCLGKTQRMEADYAVTRIPRGLIFKNVMVDSCHSAAKHRSAFAPYEKWGSIEGSPFLLISNLYNWLSEFQDKIQDKKKQFRLRCFSDNASIPLRRITIPDPDETLKLSWNQFGKLLEELCSQIDRRHIRVDAVFGINECGLAIAAHLAGKLDRTPIGYFKHRGHSSHRLILRDQSSLPDLAVEAADVLLVDSELKTGSALKAILPMLRSHYGQVKLRVYYAALYAQLNLEYRPFAKVPNSENPLPCSKLLAAAGIESLGLEDVFLGGVFGDGHIEPPLFIR